MKNLILLTIIAATFFVSGCKKSNEAILSSNWVGVYADPNSEPNLSTASSINNIIVTQVDASTLKIQMKALETSYIYNYTTLHAVSINGEDMATIDEIQGIAETTGSYHFKGTITLKGSHIQISATATNIAGSKESEVINIFFSGDRKK